MTCPKTSVGWTFLFSQIWNVLHSARPAFKICNKSPLLSETELSIIGSYTKLERVLFSRLDLNVQDYSPHKICTSYCITYSTHIMILVTADRRVRWTPNLKYRHLSQTRGKESSKEIYKGVRATQIPPKTRYAYSRETRFYSVYQHINNLWR